MLVLPRSSDISTGFADHLDVAIRYGLPDRLTLAQTPTGEPDFFLLRYSGDRQDSGGLLQMRLQFVPFSEALTTAIIAAGQKLLLIPFESGAFRIRVRSPITDETQQTGTWHPVLFSANQVIAQSINFDSTETQILQSLLQAEDNVVEVELALHYRGLVTGIPWLVTAQTQALKSHLVTFLGDQPVRVDQVIAAFLSIPTQSEMLKWIALELDAVEPDRDQMLTEIAWRSLDSFFQKIPPTTLTETPRYQLLQLLSNDSSTVSWDLIPPRQEVRQHRLSWSVSELFEQITDPEMRQKLFPIVNQVSLFGTTQIHVINFLPCDPNYLREVRLGLRFSGANGVPEYRDVVFNGQTNIERFTIVYPALMPFQLDYRLSAVLAPPKGVGWARTIKRDFVAANSSVIDLNYTIAGIEFVRVEAESEVFNKASAIEVFLPSTSLKLTPEKPSAWVALPNIASTDQLTVRCVAQPLKGVNAPAYNLVDGEIGDRILKIAAYQLEVLDPDVITLTLDPEVAPHFAYVAVSITKPTATDSGKRRELKLNQPQVYKLLGRSSVFEPVRFRYQIHYVAYNSEDNTLPIVSTDWAIAEGTTLMIRPPVVSEAIKAVS